MRRLSISIALSGAAVLTACGSSGGSPATASSAAPQTSASTRAASTGSTVSVVAGENFWGDVTRQIGGQHVKVTSIISDPTADPHTYETDPRDAAAIGSASLVVLNGAGYDDFASKLLAASPNPARTVISIDEVNKVTGEGVNPHLWYDPDYVKGAARAITAQLSVVDPADASTFAANEEAFLSAYQPYVDILASIKARHAGAPIAYTERVPGYLVQAAGLTLGIPASFPQAVEDGTDPSPRDTAAFDAAISDKKVEVLLYNGQVTDPQTDAIKGLAQKAGVPVVAMTETIPAEYADFQSWQIAQARQVLAALGG